MKFCFSFILTYIRYHWEETNDRYHDAEGNNKPVINTTVYTLHNSTKAFMIRTLKNS